MPHFIIEYSSNVEDYVSIQELVDRVHQSAADTGTFPLKGIRTRAVRREQYRYADGHPNNGFIHITARIGSGRTVQVRQETGRKIFDSVCEYLQPVYETRPLGISFELQELDPTANFRKGNIEEWMRRREQTQGHGTG